MNKVVLLSILPIAGIFFGKLLNNLVSRKKSSNCRKNSVNRNDLFGRRDTLNHFKSCSFPLLVSLLYLSTTWNADKVIGYQLDIIRITLGIVLLNILLVIALIDYYYMIIPSEVCYIGIIIGFSTNILIGISKSISNPKTLIFDLLISTFSAFLFFKIIENSSRILTKRTCLGKGDSNLAALGGAWLGLNGAWTATILAYFLAATFSLIGFTTGKLRPKQAFPFGPFLSIGIWSVWVFGEEWWWHSWLSLMGLK